MPTHSSDELERLRTEVTALRSQLVQAADLLASATALVAHLQQERDGLKAQLAHQQERLQSAALDPSAGAILD